MSQFEPTRSKIGNPERGRVICFAEAQAAHPRRRALNPCLAARRS
jgi:hypothetical protein